MNAGELRHRVLIQSPVYTQDSTGAMDIDWVDVSTVWASIEPLSARDFIAAQSEQSKVTTRITIRYREITDDMRIIHGNKIYHIEGVLPDKDSGLNYITLPCSEGVRDS